MSARVSESTWEPKDNRYSKSFRDKEVYDLANCVIESAWHRFPLALRERVFSVLKKYKMGLPINKVLEFLKSESDGGYIEKTALGEFMDILHRESNLNKILK